MKIYVKFIALALASLIVAVSFVGCQGKSAYDIAVENGFNGSEAEWLASLKGAEGSKGDAGDRGVTGSKGDNGAYIAKSYIDENGHLILEMSDGSVMDAGYVGADNTDKGKTPSISETKVCLTKGSFYLLDANLDFPIWSSSDTGVAKIAANGLIIAMGEGDATITVKSIDGTSATCELSVLDLDYTVNSDGEAVITKYKGSLSAVNIPDSIEGYPVTEIGDWAFFDNQAIKSVTLPDSVTSIGYGAFSTCNNLESIDLGEGLTYLGQSAFSDCSSLDGVILPESLESWGNAIFFGCAKLTEITVPSKITTIGGSMFDACYSLKSVTMTNVETIEGWAFYDCRALTEIALPESLVSIGEAAFKKCASLASVTFGNPNTIYWADTFEGCAFAPTMDAEGFLPVNVTMYTVVTSNYRSAPSLDEANIVDQIKKGTAVSVVGVNVSEGWAKLNIEGNTYYMRLSCLSYEQIENI